MEEDRTINETIQKLKESRQDSRQFQIQTIKTLTQLDIEIQGLKERVSEIGKIVQGSDNPDALHLQYQLFKRQFQNIETEIAETRDQIATHTQYHSRLISTRDERGWQLKNTVISVILGAIATVLLIPLATQWFPSLAPNTNVDENNANPWNENRIL